MVQKSSGNFKGGRSQAIRRLRRALSQVVSHLVHVYLQQVTKWLPQLLASHVFLRQEGGSRQEPAVPTPVLAWRRTKSFPEASIPFICGVSFAWIVVSVCPTGVGTGGGVTHIVYRFLGLDTRLAVQEEPGLLASVRGGDVSWVTGCVSASDKQKRKHRE